MVHGKGNKTRYVYVSREIIQELKTNHWKPNQTNRFAFNNFLKKVKAKMNIPANVELTPHTLRRCFTTHNALNGVPMPILQKVLGHKNIRTTSGYWKGSIDIRKFGEWLEPGSSPWETEEVPEAKVADTDPEIPQIPTKLENPSSDNSKELEYSKTIEKLKKELEQKNLIVAEKDKQLRNKDSEISLLTTENRKLKVVNQEKDKKLKELQEKVKQLTTKNISLIENSTNLKNAVKNLRKIKEKQHLENKTFLLDNLSEAKKLQNNPLVVKEKPQTELQARIQLWKPPN